MKKQGSVKRKYRSLKKNLAALKQANITPGQMPKMARDMRIWWKITQNLKDLEGSWAGAMATYVRMFKGVPRKDLGKSHQQDAD